MRYEMRRYIAFSRATLYQCTERVIPCACPTQGPYDMLYTKPCPIHTGAWRQLRAWHRHGRAVGAALRRAAAGGRHPPRPHAWRLRAARCRRRADGHVSHDHHARRHPHRGILHVHCMCTACAPHPHHTLTIPSPYPHHTLTIPSSYPHHTLTIPSPYPHHIFILTKVGGDVAIMPAIIISLVAARIAAGTIEHPFDDGLMKLHSLPFLEEAPRLHGMCIACAPRVHGMCTACTCIPHTHRMHACTLLYVCRRRRLRSSTSSRRPTPWPRTSWCCPTCARCGATVAS